MASIPQNLCVPPGTSIRLTLEAITKNGRQVALVTDPDDRLLGIVTDGDVRKALLRGASLDAPVGPNMNAAPITGRAGLARGAATELMRARGIRHLPLVDAAGRLADVDQGQDRKSTRPWDVTRRPATDGAVARGERPRGCCGHAGSGTSPSWARTGAGPPWTRS